MSKGFYFDNDIECNEVNYGITEEEYLAVQEWASDVETTVKYKELAQKLFHDKKDILNIAMLVYELLSKELS